METVYANRGQMTAIAANFLPQGYKGLPFHKFVPLVSIGLFPDWRWIPDHPLPMQHTWQILRMAETVHGQSKRVPLLFRGHLPLLPF